MVTERVAIIPARGGSKRIEKKNIIDFHGKPMIAWTIEAALETKLFTDVVVSTDDAEIAEISKHYGASVPFLRKHYADDYSPVSLATIGTLKQLQEEHDRKYEDVVQLMANCPLRTSTNIIDAVENFNLRKAKSQISCFKFGWMNPWWAVKLNEESCPESLYPEATQERSQDLPNLYCPTGAIWIAKNQVLEGNQTFHTKDRTFCEMPWAPAVDIDDQDDLKMAKMLFAMRE
jgi:CMP-N-acetylneuraminic acid synthetase